MASGIKECGMKDALRIILLGVLGGQTVFPKSAEDEVAGAQRIGQSI